MKCEEAQELITALIDDELSDSERSSIESHFKGCVRCRFVYEQEQALKREVRVAGASVSTPPGLREKILSELGIASQRDEAFKKWEWPAWPAKLTLRPAFVLTLEGRFAPMGYDLSMMGLQAVGGGWCRRLADERSW